MIRLFNPAGLAPPASRYSHGAEVSEPERWLFVSGQLGIAPDGTVGGDLETQMELAFDNVFAVLTDADMTRSDIVKLTVLVTETDPRAVEIYRATRDRKLDGHAPTALFYAVSGLAHPDFLVEIDAIAAVSATDAD